MKEQILQMVDIHKSFGNVHALSGVSLSLDKGDILGLCGENGAGKSTLMKILSGVYKSSTYFGEIFISGQKKHFENILDAENSGIAIIHQELNLIPNMTIMENIWLGRFATKNGILKNDFMMEQTKIFCKSIAPHLDPRTKIKDLGTAEKQLVEIIKAVSKNAKILIFDEPTSSLTTTETIKLIQLIQDLQLLGLTAIYISHKLDEIFQLTNKVTVLRDGKTIDTMLTKDTTEKKIISMMVGRELENLNLKKEKEIGDTVFEAKNYTAYSTHSMIKTIDNASFELKKGEILGFSGLIGAGRTALMSCIYGVYTGEYTGSSYLNNKKLTIKKPSDAIKNGIVCVPEDRKLNGIIANQAIKNNITLSVLDTFSPLGVINQLKETNICNKIIGKLKIKISSLEDPIKFLSGGNQQKCIIGKNILTNPVVLILDEPTKGVDVGAKFEIYKQIQNLAKEGSSIIIVSSELSEIINLCDRIIVMHEGKIKGSLLNQDITQEKIMNVAIGG